jgi:hypothetical protein
MTSRVAGTTRRATVETRVDLRPTQDHPASLRHCHRCQQSTPAVPRQGRRRTHGTDSRVPHSRRAAGPLPRRPRHVRAPGREDPFRLPQRRGRRRTALDRQLRMRDVGIDTIRAWHDKLQTEGGTKSGKPLATNTVRLASAPLAGAFKFGVLTAWHRPTRSPRYHARPDGGAARPPDSGAGSPLPRHAGRRPSLATLSVHPRLRSTCRRARLAAMAQRRPRASTGQDHRVRLGRGYELRAS